ncbi:MAG: hypothetical protein K1X86_10885 [Ignavibacteria bacterium]|nr:hypothetical protein [Ignavibacteria bacterium]
MKILALSRDISLLNYVDYILYKDYKIVKSTSLENLDSELNSFDLIIIDLPCLESNHLLQSMVKECSNIPLVILTEDKSAPMLNSLKNDFFIKPVLKEPLSKKELREAVKEILKKKKPKKDKEKQEVFFANYFQSPLENIVNESKVVFFRISDLQDKRVEYISDNYKKIYNGIEKVNTLKDFAGEYEQPVISQNAPVYHVTYQIKNSSSFRIVKETGIGVFDSSKYLTHIEGWITDYTNEFLRAKFSAFIKMAIASKTDFANIADTLSKLVYDFSQEFSHCGISLSLIYKNKDYFTKDFIASDFSVASDISTEEKKTGEVILFAPDNSLNEILQEFSETLAAIISSLDNVSSLKEKYSTETAKFTQELNLTSGRLLQAESAFQDKARSYDNLNELFTSAVKDNKLLSAKLNRAAVIFETNSDGKFLSANENFYRAVNGDKSNFAGKFFDEIFENLNWQNFQFEFFNNANQEIKLKQKAREGKAFFFNFFVSREESENGYKFVFYGKDNTSSKSLEIEINKQVSEYNVKVNELIDSKRANELLWNEIAALKAELSSKEETIKNYEKSVLNDDVERQEEKQSSKEESMSSGDKENVPVETHDSDTEKIKEVEEDSIFKSLRGIDFKAGLANAGDNIDTYNEILVNFENDYVDFLPDVKNKYLLNENEYVKSRLLTLAEEAKYIGADDLEKSASLFHDKINDNKVNNFDFELSVLGVHLNFTLDSIRKYKEDYETNNPPVHREESSSFAQQQIIEEQNIEVTEEITEEIAKVEVAEEIIKEEISLESEPEIILPIPPAQETQTALESQDENIESNFNELIAEPTEEKIEEGIMQDTEIIIIEDNPLSFLINDLKSSIQNSDDISIIKEKLFKLKFENHDFSKIEKIETLEKDIENGNFQSAAKILEQL